MVKRVSIEIVRYLESQIANEREHIAVLSDGFSNDREYMYKHLNYLLGLDRGLTMLELLIPKAQFKGVNEFLVFVRKEQAKVSRLLKESK